jgi:hypothetical protein
LAAATDIARVHPTAAARAIRAAVSTVVELEAVTVVAIVLSIGEIEMQQILATNNQGKFVSQRALYSLETP